MDMSRQGLQHDNAARFRPRPNGDIDPAGEAGWYLQREREQRGESLDQSGERIGIHPHHLMGIETGDLTLLPMRTEALSMIGAYAKYLGFDPQPLVLHYAQFLPQPQPVPVAARAARPRPLGSAKLINFPLARRLASMTSGASGIAGAVVAVMLLAGGAAWNFLPADGEPQQVATATTETALEPVADSTVVASINNIEETPLKDDQQTVPIDVEQAADQAAGGLSGIAALINEHVASARVEPVEKAPMQSAPAGELAAPPEPATVVGQGASGRIFGADNHNSRLALKAKSNVWIRVEDHKGNVVMTQTLMKGDIYRVPDRKGLIVITRDGGLISYAVDGVEKGNLGALGEILVGTPLDLGLLAKQQG